MGRKNIQTERRKQILEALHKCLLKKPFDKTSIKNIAQEAKINHGMLHYYFRNKEDILLNYIEYVINLYKSMFEEWLKSEGPLYSSSKDFIKGAFDFMFQKITLNRDMAKIYIEIWEIAIYNNKVKSKLRIAYSEWIETVKQIILEPIKDENKASRISTALVAFLEGISLFLIILDPKDFSFETLLENFQEAFIDRLFS
ncbi:MAG: TetR/AcrR family transcriptional regulator [Desulfobacterales bacterium]